MVQKLTALRVAMATKLTINREKKAYTKHRETNAKIKCPSLRRREFPSKWLSSSSINRRLKKFRYTGTVNRLA